MLKIWVLGWTAIGLRRAVEPRTRVVFGGAKRMRPRKSGGVKQAIKHGKKKT
jgi:hypothetical protein